MLPNNLEQILATLQPDKVFDVIIIGSGAAGLNCALQLVRSGVNPSKIAIFSEKIGGGTSFNAGSDKQTYYRLSLVGSVGDSPLEMAGSLYNGGAMHGDIALVEATNSIRCFFNLVELGVPFPQDKYGAFVGYKTDNDDKQRGTSMGPLTSKSMGENLLKEIKKYPIKLFDFQMVLRIVPKPGCTGVLGIFSLDLTKINDFDEGAATRDNNGADSNDEIDNFKNSIMELIQFYPAKNIVLATGGPSGMYKYSVYPESQWGSMNLAINMGVWLRNLTESQFGLASLDFRWNVSGSYQQVIPRYISCNKGALCKQANGIRNEDVKEFLTDYFPDVKTLNRAIFLKGYQWPFNPERIQNYGSSLIDLAVYNESIVRGRDVYLDFRQNCRDFNFSIIDDEVREYLEKSNAVQSTPIERLKHMNPKAIELYKSHGIDLYKEPLRISVCAQHNNGGVGGDIWWQTSLPGFFAIGEVNGSHGVHRPGGSALNSGQVGGLRVALKISHDLVKVNIEQEHKSMNFIDEIRGETDSILKEYGVLTDFLSVLHQGFHFDNDSVSSTGSYSEYNDSDILKSNYKNMIFLKKVQERMMRIGAYIRIPEEINKEIPHILEDYANFQNRVKISSVKDIPLVWKIYEAIQSQFFYVQAIQRYMANRGGSRGSALVLKCNVKENNKEGVDLNETISKLFPNCYAVPPNKDLERVIQNVRKPVKENGFTEWKDYLYAGYSEFWETRRPIPDEIPWFETTWREYDSGKIFKKNQ